MGQLSAAKSVGMNTVIHEENHSLMTGAIVRYGGYPMRQEEYKQDVQIVCVL